MNAWKKETKESTTEIFEESFRKTTLALINIYESSDENEKEKKTNTSVIISNSGDDRTILVYRGASDIFGEKDIQWKKIKKAKKN